MGDWIVRNVHPASAFYLAGLIPLGIGFYIWWSQQQCIAQTAGVVKDVQYEKKNKSRGYRALFAYSAGGVEYVIDSSHAPQKPNFSVGDSVTIFYDPSEPRRFYALEEKKQTTKNVFFWVGFGVVWMLVITFMVFISESK